LFVVAAIIVVAGLLNVGQPRQVTVAYQRALLAGSWQAESYALSGQKAPADDLKKIRLIINIDGRADAQRDGKTFIASTLKIDPTQEPKTMDITFTEGDDKGRTALGIYKY
jgi:uncharacterized protein (TIGR03067 family)